MLCARTRPTRAWQRQAETFAPTQQVTAVASIPPALPPHLLADHAGNPRRARLRRDHAALGHAAGDFQHELGAGRLLELLAILDRNDEGTWPADDAVLVVDIEVLDIHRECVGPLEHARQPVDGEPGREQ